MAGICICHIWVECTLAFPMTDCFGIWLAISYCFIKLQKIYLSNFTLGRGGSYVAKHSV